MDFADRGGEWRNDLLFGSSNLAATEFYQPLGQSRFFVAPYAFASKVSRNSFTGLTRVAVFGDERAGGGFDIGYNSGRRSEFRWATRFSAAELSPLIGSAGLPIVSGSTGEFRARYVWDGQDSPTIPSNGTRVVATLSRVLQSPGLPHPIGQLDVQTSTFIPISAEDVAVLRSPPEAPRSAAPPDRSRYSLSADRSISARIFRRNFSATTTPTRPWDSAAKFTACPKLSAAKSTGADGMKPAPPSARPAIPDRLWCAAHSTWA